MPFTLLLELTDANDNTATVQNWESADPDFKKFYDFNTDQWVVSESVDTKQLINTVEAGQSFSTSLDTGAVLDGVTQLRVIIHDNSGIDVVGTLFLLVDGNCDEIANELDVPRYIQFLMKMVTNKKKLLKVVDTWYLIVYDDDHVTEIMRKAIKDPGDFEITDIPNGVTAIELSNSVTVIG